MSRHQGTGRTKALRAFGITVAAVACVVALVATIPLVAAVVFSQTALRDAALRCDGTPPEIGACIPVTLPDSMATTAPPGDDTRATYRFSLATSDFEGAFPAILLSQFTDAAAVEVNGIPVTTPLHPRQRHWNQPLFAMMPLALLDQPVNRIDILIRARSPDRLRLAPIRTGDARTLQFQYNLITVYRAGLPRIGLGLALFGTLFFSILTILRRDNAAYGWLAGACLAQTVLLVHIVFKFDPLPHRVWLMVWTGAAHFCVWCLYRFVTTLWGGRNRWIEGAWIAALVLGVAVFATSAPVERYVLFSMAAVTVCFGLFGLSLLIRTPIRRRDANPLVFFAFLCVALGAGVAELLRQTGWIIAETVEVYQLIPPILLTALLTLLTQALLATQDRTARLILRQQRKVARRTEELQRTYKRLAEVTRRAAIDEERQRILLDLHDGIGGQLVNTLAYMSFQPQQDPVLRDALDSALQDLALVIDSLETSDSIATLLGSLRARVEPLLDRSGQRFNWQIIDEPVLPVPGPSQNLLVLRIVQEALNNIMKHADATVITIRTTATSVEIRDDGCGFDVAVTRVDAPMSKQHGLDGMQRRAQALSAGIRIQSDRNGTCIVLCWQTDGPKEGKIAG